MDSKAYVAEWSGLHVIDVSDPALPFEIGSLDIPRGAMDVAVVGQLAYVAAYCAGIRAVDVSDPAAPWEVGAQLVGCKAYGISVAESHAYVGAHWDGLRVLDVSNPANPIQIGWWNPPYTRTIRAVGAAGQFAYAADDSDPTNPLFHVLDVSDPTSPVGMASCTVPKCYQMAMAGSYAYCAGGQEGLRVIDLSIPSEVWVDPRVSDDVELSGSHAFVAGGSWLRVYDLADPASPPVVGSYLVPDDVVDVAIAPRYAYLANAAGGLRIVDVSDPTTPVEVGSCPVPGDARVVTVAGDYAYVGTDGGHVWAIDVSDPADPVAVGSVSIPNDADDFAVIGPYLYVSHGDGMVILNRCDSGGIPGLDSSATATWRSATP